MLSIQQIKAARGLLEWSQEDLGKRSGLSKTAITNIESGRFRPTLKTLEAIKEASEAAGLEFIEGGVKFKAPNIQRIKGPNFAKKMQEFKLETCMSQGIKELLYCGINPTLLSEAELNETALHMKSVSDAGIKTRIIVSDKRKASELPGDIECYRALPDKYIIDTSPFFIMGQYIGLMLYDVQEVLIIQNDNHAKYQRSIFEFLWDNGKEIIE